jgi:hypothetical protein
MPQTVFLADTSWMSAAMLEMYGLQNVLKAPICKFFLLVHNATVEIFLLFNAERP